jgi:7-carboxy-7-deazaguanine synthase
VRISEIYTSMQGEGPRVGIPTIFVRFAGCNLKCPGWPCDTPHAIDPKIYRSEQKILGPEQISDAVMEESAMTGAKNVSFTGGEPFIQELHHFRTLANLLYHNGMTLEVWTNGTIKWPDWSIWTLRFIMDWKLQGSGEDIEVLDTVMENVSRLTAKDVIKFTVANDADLKQAYGVWLNFFADRGPDSPMIFCGPVWDKMEPSKVAQWILMHKLPWRLNIQLHKYIWAPEARRT